MVQVDGSGTKGIEPRVVVVRLIVDRAVGAVGDAIVTWYSSVIEYGVARWSSMIAAAGLSLAARSFAFLHAATCEFHRNPSIPPTVGPAT